MNLNATPKTIRAVAEALKLAAALDDRAPAQDKARIAAWAEKAQKHGLTEPDLLDAVQDYYDKPHDRAIGIGDIVELGRARKRDRIEREPDEAREARQAERDGIAAQDVSDVAESLSTGLLGGKPAYSTPRYREAKHRIDNFPNGPGGAERSTPEHRQAARAAIHEYFAAKAEAQKQRNSNRFQRGAAAA